MRVPIIMPELGVPQATLGLWFFDEGDALEEGERLVEIHVPAATFDVSAPVSGRLASRCAFPTDSLVAGQVLGYIEEHVAKS